MCDEACPRGRSVFRVQSVVCHGPASVGLAPSSRNKVNALSAGLAAHYQLQTAQHAGQEAGQSWTVHAMGPVGAPFEVRLGATTVMTGQTRACAYLTQRVRLPDDRAVVSSFSLTCVHVVSIPAPMLFPIGVACRPKSSSVLRG